MEVGAYAKEVFSGQIEIEFITKQSTEFGSEVRVVGSSTELGLWNPGHGIPLTTATESYPYWRGTVWVPFSHTGWEYKFVVVKFDNSVEWEHGANRILAAPTSLGTSLQSLTSTYTLESVRTSSDCSYSSVSDDLEDKMTILFQVMCTCTCPGDELIITGDAHSMGNWNPSKGLRLTTCKASFPMWRGGCRLNLRDLSSAWKIVCHRADGQYEWEQHEDRRVTVQHMRDLSVEAWLILVRFGGEHEDPMPDDFSHLHENVHMGIEWTVVQVRAWLMMSTWNQTLRIWSHWRYQSSLLPQMLAVLFGFGLVPIKSRKQEAVVKMHTSKVITHWV